MKDRELEVECAELPMAQTFAAFLAPTHILSRPDFRELSAAFE
jgi:hypothetical protein